MPRPTRMDFNAAALLHNLNQVKRSAPHQKIMAIVKANAYGCGIENVVPVLEGHVDAFGVAALEEAKAIRRLGSRTDLVLLEGAFSKDELGDISTAGFQCVVHCKQQLLDVLDAKATSKKIKIWIKVDTGMHRLGFLPTEVAEVVLALKACAWVEPILGLMTHFASADELGHFSCPLQLQQFSELDILGDGFIRSLSNSAAILSLPQAHADVVRPGIMLYGVSPFFDKVGADFGLVPVMRFVSAISAIHHYPPHSPIGYGGDWVSDKASVIGVIPVGYGDGYPRHICSETPVWVNGSIAPIVGRVSMDMMTVDLTSCTEPQIGSPVELWGQHIPIEHIANCAQTIGYELLTQITPRGRGLLR